MHDGILSQVVSHLNRREASAVNSEEIYNGLMRLRGPVAKSEIVGFCASLRGLSSWRVHVQANDCCVFSP